jgi:hypothetical protein
MTAKKKQSDPAVATATKTRAVAARTSAPARPPVAVVVKDEATVEGALARVIRLAQALLPRGDKPEARGDKPEAPADAVATPAPEALEALKKALGALDSEVALKLRTLMIAGRDGKSIGDVNVNLTIDDSNAAFATAALDASQNGPLLADYLRRGHALACAAGLDLERPIAAWSSTTSHSLDERAWLSFGKQLAKAEPRLRGVRQPVDLPAVSSTRGACLVVVPGRVGPAFRSRRREVQALAEQPPLEGSGDPVTDVPRVPALCGRRACATPSRAGHSRPRR